jgi:RNA polymerase sigma factor (sigma-70 family)
VNRQTDTQLLRAYAECHSDSAFAELVRRHIDLVHSAALRMVRDSHLAQDVTQGVFVALARHAPQLADRPVLAGWLHSTAQNIAAQTVRTDVRRRAREQEVAVMNELLSVSPDAGWEHIAPHLDEALGELSEPDRDAVLLRYFKNHDLRTVGATLGISDDAAQKRVSRAVERLREFFAKRGVTVGASGLAVVISANAVQAAPVGLALTISTAAALTGTTLATTATVTATKAIAMTALQKTLVTATIAVLAGAGIYEARQAAQLSEQVQTLQQQQAAQVEELQQERDDAVKRLAFLSAKLTPRLPAPPTQVTASTNTLVDDLQPARLYARFKDNPPKLTAEQVESYLKASGRRASSLLAAYRTSGDPALLREAMEKYPNDPQVAFEAVFNKNMSPEQKRQWLNAFQQSAPDNALANFLSAREYFNAGHADQAVEELNTASGKQQLQNYTLERWIDDEEAYLSAGYSAAEAKYLATCGLGLPQLAPLKQLGQDLVDLAKAYNQSGDQTSAQAALQMAMNLGEHYVPASAGDALISQLVGLVIQRNALNAMDAQSLYGDAGQTVQDRLNQVEQQRAMLKELAQQAGSLLEKTTSDQDWINYIDRWMLFGDLHAAQWIVNRHDQQ